jgi:hypothetical protein
MATVAQITANRANAQLSTGPRTAQGQAASARNATRHGLSAATFRVLAHESQADFDQLIATLLAEHQPGTQYQSLLVEQIGRSWWLLSRAQRLEAKAFDYIAGAASDPGDGDALIVARLFDINPNTLYALERQVEKAERSFYRAQR